MTLDPDPLVVWPEEAPARQERPVVSRSVQLWALVAVVAWVLTAAALVVWMVRG